MIFCSSAGATPVLRSDESTQGEKALRLLRSCTRWDLVNFTCKNTDFRILTEKCPEFPDF